MTKKIYTQESLVYGRREEHKTLLERTKIRISILPRKRILSHHLKQKKGKKTKYGSSRDALDTIDGGSAGVGGGLRLGSGGR